MCKHVCLLTPALIWGYLRSVLEEGGSCALRGGCESGLHGQQPMMVPNPGVLPLKRLPQFPKLFEDAS